jgi:hypothetical protein
MRNRQAREAGEGRSEDRTAGVKQAHHLLPGQSNKRRATQGEACLAWGGKLKAEPNIANEAKRRCNEERPHRRLAENLVLDQGFLDSIPGDSYLSQRNKRADSDEQAQQTAETALSDGISTLLTLEGWESWDRDLGHERRDVGADGGVVVA